jgi:septum formation protein
MKIILGSSSKWRAKVLDESGLKVDELMSPGIDEKAIRHDDPEKLVLALAHAKADALVGRIQESALLITADQVVFCDGQIREKPKDQDEARFFLRTYINHPAEMVNGVVVTNTKTGRRAEGVDRASISYKPTLENVINEIIANSYAMECAGALVTENPLMQAHEATSSGGSDSFMGMPIELVKRLIAEVQE